MLARLQMWHSLQRRCSFSSAVILRTAAPLKSSHLRTFSSNKKPVNIYAVDPRLFVIPTFLMIYAAGLMTHTVHYQEEELELPTDLHHVKMRQQRALAEHAKAQAARAAAQKSATSG